MTLETTNPQLDLAVALNSLVHQFDATKATNDSSSWTMKVSPRQIQQARAALLNLCGRQTLAPDDLICDCLLIKDHEGFCNTGR